MTAIQAVMMVIQVIAIIVLFVNILFVALQRPSELKGPLLILLTSTFIMFLGYVVEIEAKSLEAAINGAAMAYIGKPFVMLASWEFICAFYHKKIPKWVTCLLSVVCVSFFWIVYTNPLHHLYYATAEYDASKAFSPLILTHGPLYNSYIILTVLFFIACIATVISGVKSSNGRRKSLYASYMLGMVLSGVLGYAVYLKNSAFGYDFTMLGVFCGTVCLSVMFFRYHIFDVLSVAKEQALEDSSMGLLVFDSDENTVFSNAAVKALLRDTFTLEQLKAVQNRNVTLTAGDRVYFVTKKELLDQGEYLGKAIEIQDITDTFNYQNRLEHDVRERTEQIESMQRSIIMSIAEIVEARSMETGEHTKRTMELVHKTADELVKEGKYTKLLTDHYIDMMSTAATLHDIGKISVPDSVLLKPGRLTPEEFEVIKTHTTSGAMVIEKAMSGVEEPEYVSICKDITLYHHERWDGNGYPVGLKGKMIPLSARIMAVADVYDAVTSKRCYKDAMRKEEAIELIRKETGTHFDPEVVEAFLMVVSAEN